MSATPHLRVSAGILRDRDGRILISERIGDSPFAGLWEFPGGKIGVGESAEDALRRELREELGIEIDGSVHFMHLDHHYADRYVEIDFFLVESWQGNPEGLDGQALCWSLPERIDNGDLLPADAPVIEALVERFSG